MMHEEYIFEDNGTSLSLYDKNNIKKREFQKSYYASPSRKE
jgi:hypothetical protein